MIKIPLRSRTYPNLYALIDDEDYPLISKYKWHPIKNKNRIYARTAIKVDGEWKYCRMHRILINTDKEIDHIDHNGLNNQRINLRECTKSENLRNQRKTSTKKLTSKYKGVSWDTDNKKWRCSIYKGKSFLLGNFDSEIDAARVYNKKAIELFGEFALINELTETV